MRNGIIALALIFSLMLASMPAAISATTDEDPCSGGTCSTYDNVTITVLEGAEKEKAIADALKDGEVKKLLLELVKTGYMPGIDDAIAMTSEDSEVIAVVIPFEQKDTGETVEIIWVYNPETGAVIVLLAHDIWCDIACYLGCIVCDVFCITFAPWACPFCVLGCPVFCSEVCG
ncbi:hypothetical protein ES703_05274 [subsurface metagenome]